MLHNQNWFCKFLCITRLFGLAHAPSLFKSLVIKKVLGFKIFTPRFYLFCCLLLFFYLTTPILYCMCICIISYIKYFLKCYIVQLKFLTSHVFNKYKVNFYELGIGKSKEPKNSPFLPRYFHAGKGQAGGRGNSKQATPSSRLAPVKQFFCVRQKNFVPGFLQKAIPYIQTWAAYSRLS